MIRGLDARTEQFLAGLERIEARQQKVQRSLSSGLRVGASSDAPERVMDILQLRSEISRANAIGNTLDRASTEVDSAEAAIRVAIQLVERARVLAAQGASGTVNDRTPMAVEARQIHDQLVSLTRTSAEGRMIFSGDRDQERLYSVDWTQPAGVKRQVTANNTRQIEDINGSRFPVGRSAHEIFDARDDAGNITEGNVFAAVHSLGIALEAEDPDAVGAAADQIVMALEHLARQMVFYGHAQNRVRDAINLNKSSLIARQKELGLAQDTDVAEALIELNLAKLHQEASLGAQARMPRTSLFDYLA